MRTRAGDFVLSANATSGDLSATVKVTHDDGAPATIVWATGDTASLTSNVAANKTYAGPYSGPILVQFDDFTSTGTEIDCVGPVGISLDQVPKSCTSFKQVGYEVTMEGTSLPTGLLDVHVECIRSALDVDRCIQALEDNGQSNGTLFLAERGAGKRIDLLESRGWTCEVEPPVALDIGKSQAPHTSRVAGKTIHHVDRLRRGDRRPRRAGKALSLAGGTSDYADGSDDNFLSYGGIGGTFTIGAWVKTSSSGTMTILSKYNTDIDERSILLRSNNGNFEVYVSSTGLFNDDDTILRTALAGNAVNDGAWHHVAATFDAGDLKLFVDGEEVPTNLGSPGNLVTSVFNSASLWKIGAYNTNLNRWTGDIDDVRVYIEKFTADQIRELANLRPGSLTSARGLPKPALWFDFEESTDDPTLRNKGYINDADMTLQGTVASMRADSDRYCFADELGASSCFVTEGGDYINTKETLDGATAFTVWRRMRYLSKTDYDLDGFVNSGSSAIRFGRHTTANNYYVNAGKTGITGNGIGPLVADGEVFADSLRSTSGGNYTIRLNGTNYNYAGGTFTVSNTRNYLIGAALNAVAEHGVHAEYYEYLIANRVLTDDEILWLDTGGEYGTPVDVLNDPNILVYYDFEDVDDTIVYNKANPSKPGIIVGGEWGVVPASPTKPTKDIDQEDYFYSNAILHGSGDSRADLNQILIGPTEDFDVSFYCKPTAVSANNDEGLFSQYTLGVDGRLIVHYSNALDSFRLFIGQTSGNNIDMRSRQNGVDMNRWHHVRVRRSGDLFELYVDGRLENSETKAGVSIQQKNTMLGTDYATAADFQGYQTNVKITAGDTTTTLLTAPDETLAGATLTNVTYSNQMNGKPGEMTWQGQNPLDPIIRTPCIKTNGSSDFLEADFTVASSTTRSVAMWIKETPGTNTEGKRFAEFAQGATYTRGIAIISDDRAGADGWGVLVGSSSANFTIYSYQGELSTTSHVAVTVNGTDVRIYLNGEDVTAAATITTGGTGFSGTLTAQTHMELGNGSSTTHNLYGAAEMFDCILYSDTLTHEEVIGVMRGEYPTDNLEGHWHLSDNDGEFCYDRSGNNRHLQINGTVSLIRDATQEVSDVHIANGYSLATQFDGNDSLNKTGRVTEGTITQLSGAAWIRPDGFPGSQTIASEYLYSSDDRSWNWRLSAGADMEFVASSDGTGGSTIAVSELGTDLVADTFHHVAFVYDAGTVYWYLDGVLIETDTSGTTALYDSAADFTIGNSLDTQFFNGDISHLVIEQGIWDLNDVKALMSYGTEKEILARRPSAKVFLAGGSGDESMTKVGDPVQVVVPGGPNLPPISYGPGVPTPGQKRPLASNASSPYALRYAGALELGYDDMYHEAVFPGSNNYVDLGAVLLGATDDFDISFEFFANANPTNFREGLLSQYTLSTDGRFQIMLGGVTEGLRLFVDVPSGVDIDINEGSGVGLSTWHTARVTRVGNVFSLYKNGQLVGQDTKSTSIQAKNTQLGSDYSGVNDFNGRIRNVVITNNGVTTEFLNEQKGLPGATLTNVTVESGAAIDNQLFQRSDHTAVLYETAMSQDMADIVAAKKYYN